MITMENNILGLNSILILDNKNKRNYENKEYVYVRITSDNIDITSENDKNSLGYYLTKQQALALAENLIKIANTIK